VTRPVGGVPSLVRAVVASTAVCGLVACSSGSGDTAAAPATVTPTVTPTVMPTVTPSITTSATPTSAASSDGKPTMGPITPSGRPTLTVPPSPAASIGAACLKPGDGARPITFRSSSGASLTGAVLGRGRAGVVLVHQSDGDLCQWLPYARDLARAGYQVLSMDLEGRGSAGFVQYDGDQPVPYGFDVAAAAQYLRTHGAAKVVLVGASMGATSVLAGAAITRPVVNGVISLSASASFAGIDARTAATRLTAPVLYVAGTDDSRYAEVARTLYAATRSKRSLTIVPGSLHGVEFIQEPGLPAVRHAVDAFIASHAQ
jgi:pimeloyl-ACP methyl ester carboxylesterase